MQEASLLASNQGRRGFSSLRPSPAKCGEEDMAEARTGRELAKECARTSVRACPATSAHPQEGRVSAERFSVHGPPHSGRERGASGLIQEPPPFSHPANGNSSNLPSSGSTYQTTVSCSGCPQSATGHSRRFVSYSSGGWGRRAGCRQAGLCGGVSPWHVDSVFSTFHVSLHGRP